IMLVKKRGDSLGRTEVALEPGSPAGPAAVDEGRIERIGAIVDPVPKSIAPRQLEDRLEASAVLERHNIPVHGPEDAVDSKEEAVLDHAVQTLPVVVDDPPDIADVVLPSLKKGFEDVSLVQFRITCQCDHPARRLVDRHELLEPEIILDKRGKQGNRNAKSNRARREINLDAVLSSRGIRLRSSKCAEALELFP